MKMSQRSSPSMSRTFPVPLFFKKNHFFAACGFCTGICFSVSPVSFSWLCAEGWALAWAPAWALGWAFSLLFSGATVMKLRSSMICCTLASCSFSSGAVGLSGVGDVTGFGRTLQITWIFRVLLHCFATYKKDRHRKLYKRLLLSMVADVFTKLFSIFLKYKAAVYTLLSFPFIGV